MLKPVGILGGTFDPVHYGHLRLALEACRLLDLREVRMLPLYLPPHRDAPVAAPAQRLAMLRLAAAHATGLIVDDREIVRGGISYSINTVRALRREFPEQPLCLIIGMDEFHALDTWREWTRLTDYVHLIIVDRPGLPARPAPTQPEQLLGRPGAGDPSALSAARAGAIQKIRPPLLEISATYLRKLVHAGQSIRYLTPDPVIDFITQEKLYL
jgi:nicotinate-nucleotide adenylyltransferase